MTTQQAGSALLQITGPDLARYAWHAGTHHVPCQIDGDRLLMAPDAGLAALMRDMGAQVAEVTAQFTPEKSRAKHGQVHHHSSHTHIEDDDETAADEA